ncbi:MAG: phosphoenolpyruvate mutase [Ramlibacter sp.]|nr:phosphoenolpyruvate mutase [Ramlibacter sp.]
MKVNYQDKCRALKSYILGDDITFVMEAHNALSARIAQEAGFRAVWASGLSISATLGLADRNHASWTQVLDVAEFMADHVSVPVLLDGDTGFGNYQNVMRLTRKLGQRGIAGVCLEDKIFPKLNSFLGDNQELTPIDDFCSKLRAAKDSQVDENFSVIARTETLIAGRGMEEALERAERYREAGADAILIHSKRKTADEVLEFARRWERRSPLVVVPTMYYRTPASAFRDAGISCVIWANHSLRSSISAMRRTTSAIMRNESVAPIEEDIASLDEVFNLTGEVQAREADKRYAL